MIVPSRWSGGESLKFMLRNPIAVVTLVTKTGTKFTRRLSTRAGRFAVPCRISPKKVTRTWIESATAMVKIIVGASADTGSSRVPTQPAKPRAVVAEKPMTITVARVPGIDRNNTIMARTRIPYMIGTSVPRSLTPAS